MKLGFPVVLLVDKKINDKTVHAGTKCKFSQKIGDNQYRIKYCDDEKRPFLIDCTKAEFKNYYKYELEKQKKSSLDDNK